MGRSDKHIVNKFQFYDARFQIHGVYVDDI